MSSPEIQALFNKLDKIEDRLRAIEIDVATLKGRALLVAGAAALLGGGAGGGVSKVLQMLIGG